MKKEIDVYNEKVLKELGEYKEKLDDEKVYLYFLQNGQCMYTKQELNLNGYLKDCEIDHIIPQSVYDEDSLDNKVLVLKGANQEKGNRIPYDYIKEKNPEMEVEILTMKTTGDKILDRTLDKVGGKGLFVKELDAALLDGRVDLTVHSCKDLPMEEDPRIPLAGFSRREDPRDVLVLPQGAEELDPSRPIGCASARRAVQLRALFPGVAVAPVRGNVLTKSEAKRS